MGRCVKVSTVREVQCEWPLFAVAGDTRGPTATGQEPPSEPRPPVTSSKTLANVNRPEQPRPVFYPPFRTFSPPILTRSLPVVYPQFWGFSFHFCSCSSHCLPLLSLVCFILFVGDDDLGLGGHLVEGFTVDGQEEFVGGQMIV